MCAGSCYLKSVIKENHNPKDDPAIMALSIGDQKAIYLDQINKFELLSIPEEVLLIQKYLCEYISDSFLLGVFRPPKC